MTDARKTRERKKGEIAFSTGDRAVRLTASVPEVDVSSRVGGGETTSAVEASASCSGIDDVVKGRLGVDDMVTTRGTGRGGESSGAGSSKSAELPPIPRKPLAPPNDEREEASPAVVVFGRGIVTKASPLMVYYCKDELPGQENHRDARQHRPYEGSATPPMTVEGFIHAYQPMGLFDVWRFWSFVDRKPEGKDDYTQATAQWRIRWKHAVGKGMVRCHRWSRRNWTGTAWRSV